MKTICAVTGVSGYVGSRLAARLRQEFTVVPLGRAEDEDGIRWAFGTDVAAPLRERGVDFLVHAAWEFGSPRESEEGSRKLIEDAKTAGVKRMLFISSISAFAGARSEYGKAKVAVERTVLETGGTVIRPGLVWGPDAGAMFGSLRDQAAKGGIVPVIGDGRYPQYLVHEDDLADAVIRVVRGEFAGRVLTVANPRMWMFRDLIQRMAREQGKQVKLVGIPWRLVYGGLKTAEMMGLKLNFRSDSVISLVNQDSAPQFAAEIPAREFV